MYQKVMVPLDGSQLAECVLPHVEAFINGCQAHTLIFVTVVEPSSQQFWGARTTTSQLDFGQVLEYLKRIEEDRKSSPDEYLQGVMGRLKHNGIKFQKEVLTGNWGPGGRIDGKNGLSTF